MTTTSQDPQEPEFNFSELRKNHRTRRIIFGVLVVLIGGALLGKKLGLFLIDFQAWPLVLIAIGIYFGIKHRFRNFASWALIGLGTAFMIPGFLVLGVPLAQLAAPMLLILAGLFLIMKPYRKHHFRNHCNRTYGSM